jgi:hypothetical protein
MNPYTIWFVLFAFLGYYIVTDASVARFFVLVTQFVQVHYQKYKWIIIHHPKTPWARYSMHRRSMKLAEELMKELEKKNDL